MLIHASQMGAHTSMAIDVETAHFQAPAGPAS